MMPKLTMIVPTTRKTKRKPISPPDARTRLSSATTVVMDEIAEVAVSPTIIVIAGAAAREVNAGRRAGVTTSAVADEKKRERTAGGGE